MTTRGAALVRPVGDAAVCSVRDLVADGTSLRQIGAQCASGRWRRYGNAVVRHNGPLSERQRHAVAMVNAGPRALLTSFTGLAALGLQHWHRDDLHLLVPAGARVRRVPGITVAVHAQVAWPPCTAPGRPHLHAAAEAAVLAASGTRRSRVGVALLAACVQQRLTTADDLDRVVRPATNLRHRSTLLAAIGDIGMGAHALTEIDFARTCRRAGLAEPLRQAVRVEPSGRRRYLDVEWRCSDGRAIVAEVDGAVHLGPERWWDDQLRQNEVTIGRSTVLRFPAPLVRERDPIIVDQLRRAGVPLAHGRTTAADRTP